MSRLLNVARTILLEPTSRQDYDQILSSWVGPVSTDGTPVITSQRMMLAEFGQMGPDGVESVISRQRAEAEVLTGYSPTLLDFLEGMMSAAGDDVPDALRTQYEDALLAYDRVLAIEDDSRSKLLGRPSVEGRRYVAGTDYAGTVAGEIEDARQRQTEELRQLALANVSGRLALMAGEGGATPSIADAELDVPMAYRLPSYFDSQAEKMRELAEERQIVARKRLANLWPTYPEAESQIERLPGLVVGVLTEDSTAWLSVDLDVDANVANIVDLPEGLLELLQSGDILGVIQRGYNVLTFSPLEHLDIEDLLGEVIQKHIQKYSAGTNAE